MKPCRRGKKSREDGGREEERGGNTGCECLMWKEQREEQQLPSALGPGFGGEGVGGPAWVG